eukprot:5475360-Ditylum_brightwellii.AAC.1
MEIIPKEKLLPCLTQIYTSVKAVDYPAEPTRAVGDNDNMCTSKYLLYSNTAEQGRLFHEIY